MNLPSGEHDSTRIGNNLYFIFFKNPEIPTFGGISRMVPIIDNQSTDSGNSASDTGNVNIDNGNEGGTGEIGNVILEEFQKMKTNNELTSTMLFNDEKVRIIPETMTIIFPEVYQGMIYNPHEDNFYAPPNIITPDLSRKMGDKLIIMN